MAGGRRPGPQGLYGDTLNIEDGTVGRAQLSRPGPLGMEPGKEGPSGEGHQTAEHVRSLQNQIGEHASKILDQKIGYRFSEVLKESIPRLLQAFDQFNPTTSESDIFGTTVDKFPDVHVSDNRDLLSFLGLTFLSSSSGSRLAEICTVLPMKIRSMQGNRRRMEIFFTQDVDRTSNALSEAVVGIIICILQAIVAELSKDPFITSQTGAEYQRRQIGADATVANKTVRQLVGRLRASRLGDGFAKWVERNWQELLWNDQLRYLPPLSIGGMLAAQSSYGATLGKPGDRKSGEKSAASSHGPAVHKRSGEQNPRVTNVSGPKDLGCGGVDWKVWFDLPKAAEADGWVVQEINAVFEVKDASGATIQNQRFHFWEAWEVKKGKTGTVWQDQKLDDNDDQYGTGRRANTKGSISVLGKAKFYPGPLPPDFVKNNPDTLAHILHSTTKKPEFWDDTGTTHNIISVWDCTKTPGTSEVTAQAGDKKIRGTR